MAVMELTLDEIDARIRAAQHTPVITTYVRTAAEQADSLITALAADEGITLGLPEIDILTRGFRPKDLVVLTGFAHSGKTQLVNTMVLNNVDKRILFFTLDDPAEMVLAKLVSMSTGIPAEELERRIRQGDEAVKDSIRNVAKADFQNLLMVDDSVALDQMQQAVDEATAVWGAPPDAVVVDYLEMIPGATIKDDSIDSVKRMAKRLKAWAHTAAYPLIVLHQGTRSGAKPGSPISMTSMAYGGEQEATIVLGVRRKRDRQDEDIDPYERRLVEDTVTLHVPKNKRPGGRLTHYDGIDFYLEPTTGLIRPLSAGDLRVNPTAAEAARELRTPAANIAQSQWDFGVERG